jgi:hypothetical protein
LNSLYIRVFRLTIRKEMNRTNSLIILASITLSIYLVFNTFATTSVFALESNEYTNYPLEYSNEKYNDDSEYSSDSYDGYYDNYENGFYEDRYGKLYFIE